MSAFTGVTLMTGTVSETETLRQTITTLLEICNHEDVAEVLITYPDRVTDECLAVVNELAAMECDVPIRVFEQKHPFIAFVIDLIEAAEGSHCILVPSDMALDLSMVPEMIERAKKESDTIFSASRWLKGCEFYDYGRVKKLINFCAQKFLAVLYMRNLTDFTNPVQIAPSELYKSINFEETGFAIFAEMILKPIRLGYKFEELPTNCYSRTEGKSSNSWKQILSYLRVVLHIRFMPKKAILLEEYRK